MQRGFLFPLRKGEKHHAYPASTGKKTGLYLPLQGAASSGPVSQLLRQRAPLLRRQQQRATGVSGGRRAGPGHGGLSVPQAPGFAGGGPDPDAGGPGVRGEPVRGGPKPGAGQRAAAGQGRGGRRRPVPPLHPGRRNGVGVRGGVSGRRHGGRPGADPPGPSGQGAGGGRGGAPPGL